MTDTIGLFGLGLIGTALTKRTLTAERSVMGYDPAPSRMDAFAELGGTPSQPLDVWTAAVVFAAVFDTDQLASLIENAPQNANAILISTSTCDPERMPELARLAYEKGIVLIEAPLSGTSKDLSEGNAVFLLAGDRDIISELDWLWRILGRAHYHVGEVGNGNRAKLAVNLVLGLNRAALAEGLVFAESLGLTAPDFLPLLKDTAAYSATMDSKGDKMVERDFAPLGRIAQSAKDFELITSSARASGQALPFATTYQDMMALCIETGGRDLDNSAILLAIEMSKTK
jgi:3-hydroxyisobutyrate dehydrogenase-like beta-hydroxyacid dehydrogenase